MMGCIVVGYTGVMNLECNIIKILYIINQKNGYGIMDLIIISVFRNRHPMLLKVKKSDSINQSNEQCLSYDNVPQGFHVEDCESSENNFLGLDELFDLASPFL